MLVTLLVDNLTGDGLRSEHGLSFLVETDEGSVLFDTGQSEAWLDNLRALGRDRRTIRAVAISHGHYDCTGIAAYEYLRSKLVPRVTLGRAGMSWRD